MQMFDKFTPDKKFENPIEDQGIPRRNRYSPATTTNQSDSKNNMMDIFTILEEQEGQSSHDSNMKLTGIGGSSTIKKKEILCKEMIVNTPTVEIIDIMSSQDGSIQKRNRQNFNNVKENWDKRRNNYL